MDILAHHTRNGEIALSVIRNSIHISDLRLLNNTGPAQEDSYSLLEFSRSVEALTSLRNITIWNNFGHSSVINSDFNCGKIDHHIFEMSYLNISGNVFNTTLHVKTGLIHFKCAPHIELPNCSIENNIHSETGFLLQDSHIYFNGTVRDLIGWKAMVHALHWPKDYIIDVTSDPLHVCDCSTESVEDSYYE